MAARMLVVVVLLYLCQLSWSLPGAFDAPKNYPDLLNADAKDLVAGLRSGAWTSVDLTRAYMRRIAEVNGQLHAVVEMNPDALSIAAALDAERKNGIVRSPLHGIPMLIKNNIATADRMNNTAGSYALLGAKVPRDATVAAKLRAAGVILLGKTNMSQWANVRSSNSSSGWSAHGGQTTGAYYPDMDPSGSSSGSGVASSIGLAFAALGTETDGSIILPASTNGLVGIKPTVGLTSRSLVIPISPHMDTVGPMARSVADAALVLSIIAGKDASDNYTLAQPAHLPDYAGCLSLTSLKGARIGVPRQVLDTLGDSTSGPIFAAFNASIDVMRKAGAIIVDPIEFPAWADIVADKGDSENAVLAADLLSTLPIYFSQLTYNPLKVKNLADVSNFTQHFKLEDYPERDTAFWDTAFTLFNNTDPEFWPIYQQSYYFGAEGGVLGALKKYKLDAIILPTDFASSLPARAGLPVVTVPMGSYPKGTPVVKQPYWNLVEQAPNIPLGLSILGAKWSEESLIGYAYAFEQKTLIRSKLQPYVVPKSQLADIVGKS